MPADISVESPLLLQELRQRRSNVPVPEGAGGDGDAGGA
jgi:hypothetical protein